MKDWKIEWHTLKRGRDDRLKDWKAHIEERDERLKDWKIEINPLRREMKDWMTHIKERDGRLNSTHWRERWKIKRHTLKRDGR